MSELRITFCDLCNVHQKFVPARENDGQEQVVDADDPTFILCNGPGYVYTDAESATAERGWVETDYGHQCPVCFAEEEAENALDEETGAESGAHLEPTILLAPVGFDFDATCTPEAGLPVGPPRKPVPPTPGKKLRRKK